MNKALILVLVSLLLAVDKELHRATLCISKYLAR